MNTSKTALVTGGSSGIGYELSLLLAKNGYDLVLVAQNEQTLEGARKALAEKFSVRVECISLDLGLPDSIEKIVSYLHDTKITIDILINNAGFAVYGEFQKSKPQSVNDLLAVNIIALTNLTRALLPKIVDRKGKILNVGSVASFLPGPGMAVYYASKAYVLSFSEALSEELRGSGVTVTALCPGATATGFSKRAELHNSKLFDGPLLSASQVAHDGFRALMKGTRICIPGLHYKFMIFLLRFLPRSLITRIAGKIQQEK